MPATDLELLEAAARDAGEIACRFWREDPHVWDKGGDNPVSEADISVDNHLRESLLAARPDYAWVSEETADDPARLSANRVFVVDPIDGTRAFIAGERTWAHSLAVVENGTVTAACVYLPVLDKMYLAGVGGGARLNGAALNASVGTDIEGASVLTARVTMQDKFWKAGAPRLDRHFRPSLAYRLSLVGEGRYDAMMTLRPTWEWDIAAGALIAAEAGASVSDRHGGDLSFNSEGRMTAGVVAGASGVHRQILDALA